MSPSVSRPVLLASTLALAVVGWAYWATFLDIGDRWINDPQYTHGFLVPAFSAYLLWRYRSRLTGSRLTGSRLTGDQPTGLQPRWWGAAIVLLGAGLRLASVWLYQPWLDPLSLLVVLAGVAAAVGGRRALAWSAPAILFLAFMIPLPYRFQIMLGGTLQRVATSASTYALQTLGVPAVAEGNVIVLSHERLGVVEACNGLSMLVTFFALAAGVAILARRGVLEKVLIVASAVPIAVAANVVRISLTGLLFEAHQGEWARAVFHDFAGLLMMPVALLLFLGLLVVLKRSIVPVPDPSVGHA